MQAFLASLALKALERLLKIVWDSILSWKKRNDKVSDIEEASKQWQEAKTTQEKKDAFKKLIGSSRPGSLQP